MLGSTVYEAVLDSMRKDKRGNTLQLSEFNRLSPIVSRRVLADFAKKFEEGIDVSSSIGAFKKIDQVVNLTSGIANLPSDYYQLIGEPWYIDTTDTNDPSATRTIDVVTSLQRAKRRTDYLTQPSAKYPICEIGSEDASGNIRVMVWPTTITSLYIDYIRETASPFLDYYINDSTLEYTYMTEGQQNVSVASGYTYRDGTTGTKNSTTVDWDFGEDDLPIIVAYFKAEMGSVLPDEGLLMSAEKDKSQIND